MRLAKLNSELMLSNLEESRYLAVGFLATRRVV